MQNQFMNKMVALLLLSLALPSAGYSAEQPTEETGAALVSRDPDSVYANGFE